MNDLPKHVLSVLKYSNYDAVLDRDTISASQLIDAPHIRILGLKYPHIENKPDMLIASMYGSVAHTIVERSDNRTVRELRIDSKILLTDIKDNVHSITLTGKFDNYDPKLKILYDNKFVHHNSLNYSDTIEKWEQQLNIYAYLIKREFGWDVRKLKIIVWIRDMTSIDVLKPDYPDNLVFPIELKLWSFSEQEEFVMERLKYHINFKYSKKGYCTLAERWGSNKVWSVKKRNSKRAYRNFEDKRKAAQLYMQLKNKATENKKEFEYIIEYRRPEDRRCRICKYKGVCVYPNMMNANLLRIG